MLSYDTKRNIGAWLKYSENASSFRPQSSKIFSWRSSTSFLTFSRGNVKAAGVLTQVERANKKRRGIQVLYRTNSFELTILD